MTDIKRYTQNRDIILDLVKLVACWLMLWGHCIGRFSEVDGMDDVAFRIIYTFHMPLFMTMVGYFSISLINGRGFWEALSRRSRQLLLPMVVMSVPFILLNIYHQYPAETIINFSLSLFWFLKSAFACTFLWLVTRKVLRKPILYFPTSLAIALSTELVPELGFMALPRQYPFFLYGLILRRYMPLYYKNAIKILIISVISFAIMVSYWELVAVSRVEHPGFAKIMGSDTLIYLYKSGMAFAGVNTTISLIYLVFEPIKRHSSVIQLSKFGQITLGVYLFQSLLLEAIASKLINLTDQPRWLYDWVYTPLLAIFFYMACWYVIYLVKQNRITSFLLLGIR